ncbi:hypothetical protein ACLOJK_003831 [Asimina triloba]
MILSEGGLSPVVSGLLLPGALGISPRGELEGRPCGKHQVPRRALIRLLEDRRLPSNKAQSEEHPKKRKDLIEGQGLMTLSKEAQEILARQDEENLQVYLTHNR